MSRVGLKIYGTTKYLDDASEEILGSVSGINLCQTGPFIYATGNGSSAGTGTVAISKLIPPANVGGVQAQYAHACGLVDSWNTNAPSALAAYRGASDTATGAGTFRNWDLASFSNSRPFMIGILGDTTAAGSGFSLKVNGVTKSNLVQSADQSTSVLRRITSRQNCTLNNGITGSIRASKLGNCVVINMAGLTTTDATAQNVGTVPSDCKPAVNVVFQLINHNLKEYWTGYINANNGNIVIYNPNKNKLVSNAWGCAIYSTSNADVGSGADIFTKAPLKINGVQKTLQQINNANFTCRYASVASGYNPLHLWRWGNLVVGNCYYFRTGQTAAFNGNTVFTIPAGFRPAATSYSSGYGFVGQTNSPQPATGNRLAFNIGTDGKVQAWSKAAFQYDVEVCGLSFYYHCNS
jgi:hypothetical protein